MKKWLLTSRSVAAETLSSFFSRQIPIPTIFDAAVSKAHLSSNDRALAMELVYGVLRHHEQLDRILEILSKTPLPKLNPFVHQVIAVGLYQIFFLDRIPESAAVNEAVESCKRHRPPIGRAIQGFVNGVLRQAIRQKEELHKAMTRKCDGRPIYNHPAWLERRWISRFGQEEAERLFTINNRVPSQLTLRVNTLRIKKERFYDVLTQAGYLCHYGIAPDAIIVENGGIVSNIPGYHDGFFQVQDQAAQFASLLLAPFSPQQTVLDGCTGLGGKASYLLQSMPDCTLYAVEPHAGRVRSFYSNISRLFEKREGVTLYDSDFFQLSAKTIPPCSRIMLDVPCSGTGVIRRQPDIRWNRTEEDISRYHKKQIALLEHAVSFAAADCVIVYAACSLEEEENEDIITKFLQKNEMFRVQNPAPFLPKKAHCFIRGDFFAPLPSDDIDGFFAARLVCGRI